MSDKIRKELAIADQSRLPELSIFRLVVLQIGGCGDDLPGIPERCNGAGGDQLNRNITQRRSLGRAGDNLDAGGIGGKLRKKIVFGAAADNVNDRIATTAYFFDLLRNHPILKGKTFVDATDNFAAAPGTT